jgi:streptomycin 6-kinase
VQIDVPSDFGQFGGPAVQRWIAELPTLADRVCVQWGLEQVGPARYGGQGVLLPVSRSGRTYALKLQPADDELADAALGLEIWAGRGVVALIEHDLAVGALLLEWLDGERSLDDVPIDEAAAVAGRLIREMAVPAGPGLPCLVEMAREWADGGLARRNTTGLVPAEVIRTAALWSAELGPTAANLLLSRDLHYENVLSGRDGAWVAIDPKPMVGDPEYAVAPLLWRRLSDDLADRWQILLDSAGLDERKARGWGIVHTVDYWLWAVGAGLTEDPVRCAAVVNWLMRRSG